AEIVVGGRGARSQRVADPQTRARNRLEPTRLPNRAHRLAARLQPRELVASGGVRRRRGIAGVERAVAVEIEIDSPADEQRVALYKAALVEQLVELLSPYTPLFRSAEIVVGGRGARSQRVADPQTRARNRLEPTRLPN